MAKGLRAAVLACLTMLPSVAAEARDGIINLTVTGEAYNGAPKFRLLANGREIGSGAATSAIDTQTGAKLQFVAGASPPPSNIVSIKIPDIDDVSRLDVEFTNDAWAGPGKPGDRSFYLLALSVSSSRKAPNGSITTIREFLPGAFEAIMPKPGGYKITSQFAALTNNGSLRLMRPKEGWISGSDSAASAKPGAANQACGKTSLALGPFEKNVADLSSEMLKQLSLAAKSFAGKPCTIVVTGFANGGSPGSFQSKLSRARAQAVARELTRLGIPGDKVKVAIGPGNGRRIVITLR